MGHNLSSTVDSRIITFNTLALQTQDEAYTLAFYLLGDEHNAEQATQAAFGQLQQYARLELSRFRLEVLRRVVEGCQRISRILPNRSGLRSAFRMVAQRDETFQNLLNLNESERFVIVLVDVLGLNYGEAAQVLSSSKKQVGKTLAQARWKLSQVETIQQAAPLAIE
jgi:DNA-directed RNA polymerase specialized sigma24 family protein